MTPSPPPPDAGALGATFKRLRVLAGVKQDALAVRAGISKSHLSRFENGERAIGPGTYPALIAALVEVAEAQRAVA